MRRGSEKSNVEAKQKPSGHDPNAPMAISKARKMEELGGLEERRKILDSFDVVMADIDGVLTRYGDIIPGSGEAVMDLKKMGKRFIIVTNESKPNDDEFMELFKKMGISEIGPDEIIHPAKAIGAYLQRFFVGQTVFSLITGEMNETFVKSGLKVKAMDPLTNVKVDTLHYLFPEELVRAVVYDTNFNLTYAQLATAKQFLDDEQCAFIVGATDTYLPLKSDLTTIGPAGFINMLRESTNREPVILGKPGRLLGDELVRRFTITEPERVLFIGGNLINDINFAISCKFQSVFVCSGYSNKEQIPKLSEELKPDYMAANIAEFVSMFKGLGAQSSSQRESAKPN